MLPDKIEITESFREYFKSERKKLRVSAPDLSLSLGRSQSYISALEHGRINAVKKNNLVSIFEKMYKVGSAEAERKLEDTIISQQNDNNSKLQNYKTIDDSSSRNTRDKLIDDIKSGFEAAYKHNPDFTISTLKRFATSLHFDLGFMLTILRVPYFAFEGLDHDERQNFLNELADTFNKYAELSKKHLDEKKEDETPASQDTTTFSNNEEPHDFNADPESSDQ